MSPGFVNFSSSDRIDLRALAAVFLVFSAICLVTAIFYDGTAETLLNAQYKGAEKTLGPIETERANSVLVVEIAHALSIDRGFGTMDSFVEGEVLDANRQYLFSFGKDFYAEAGYDEGNYYESDTSTSMKVTLQDPGTYYLRLKAEGSLDRQISVTVSRQVGSGLLHRVLGILALLAGIALLWIGNRPVRTRR